jgi:type II secretory pathway pseudopilin PulG
MSFSKRKSGERGYVLLALLLFVALLSIGIFTTIQRIDFQIKRDREEELIHRGVQYSRAVRKYFKKFGRYPTRLEELENTNNYRSLRRRYKDPITGKDFKLLHLTDVQMSFNSGSAPGVPVSEMGNQQGAPGALNGNTQGPAGFGPSSITPQQESAAQTPSDVSQGDQTVTNGDAGTPPPPQPLAQQAGPNGAPQVFGGGGIVGVASVSKDKTIREFNKKNHYNQWQFIYDPTTDRGGLLMTPNQPPLMLGNNPNQQQNGTGTTGFGNSQTNSGFGNSSGQQPPPAPTMQNPNQQ